MPAGYGKVAVLDELRTRLLVSHDRVVYVGDGSSDVHVMLHVNRLDGLTIAVSENKFITQIAARTVLSDDALSVLIPVLEDIVGWNSTRIRSFFEAHGFVLRDWEKVRTDSLTIGQPRSGAAAAAARGPANRPIFRYSQRDFRVEPICRNSSRSGGLVMNRPMWNCSTLARSLGEDEELRIATGTDENCGRGAHGLQDFYAVVLRQVQVEHHQVGRRRFGIRTLSANEGHRFGAILHQGQLAVEAGALECPTQEIDIGRIVLDQQEYESFGSPTG